MLWIVFSIFAKFPNETRLEIVLEFGVVFLIPAMLIEIFKNPTLKKQQNDMSAESAESFGQKLKKLLFPFRWVYVLLISMWVYGTFFSSFAETDGLFVAAIIYGVLFIVPIIVLEIVLYAKKHRKPTEPREKNTNANPDRYISLRRIIGLVLLPLAVLFVVIGVAANADPNTYSPNNMYPGITFGVMGLVLLLSSIGDPKTKTELAERKKAKLEREEKRLKEIAYRGVYLTEEQIHNLESEIELPVLDTPVFLNYGEVAVYHSQATRQETKNRVIGRTGSYGGGTVRIAKGLSIHTGGSSGRPIYGDVSMQYPGEFIITNERVIFLSSQKGFELKHQNITAATAYKDGFAFQSKSTSYVLLVPRADLATLAFDGVRTGEIPIAGIDTSDDYDYDNYDAFDPADISSIDGMEGHDFEYFCADLLRRDGFSEVSVTKGSGDQGVDVLATKGGIKYAIQCKNYASALGNTPVQEVNAGKTFYNCHVGVVMTNSTFTPGAISLANATGVLLWDRSTLAELMRNEQPAAEKTVEVPVEVPPTAQPKDAVPAEVKATSVAPTPQVNPRQDMQQSLKQKKSIRIDNIGIDIDVTSTDRFGIVLDNFGIERDEDDDDQLELLFDIVNRNGRTIRCDIDIVCNLYAGCRKVTTERVTVYKDSFDGRDSVSIYFDKKNIAKTATRIELFCQKW